jgi:hypothetical protein
MSVSVGSLTSCLLNLLPKDGSPVLNRVMRVMLARELAKPVPAELYAKATDQLVRDGTIGKSRGQSGSIFLAVKERPSVQLTQDEIALDVWSEARLMEPLRQFLDGPFKEGLSLPKGSFCVVQDTSMMGPTRGRWARPDFIVVSGMPFKLLPGSQIDVHSFELKSETGANDLAVYEALAQTRFTHFGHLVWHLPERSKAEVRLPDIEKQCDDHGVGLIRMYDPNRPEGHEILLDPVRKPTLPAIVDGFLESRLAVADQKKFRAVFSGAPA